MKHSTQPPKSYRAALVTGATSGIGEAFARALPDSTDLLLTGRDGDALDRLTMALSRPGRRVETLSADLATESGLDGVIESAEAFGIDLLVANAGQGPFGYFLDAPEDSVRDTVLVNALAPAMLLRRLLPGMLDRADAGGARAGAIVVASDVAFLPVPKLATYAATKAFDLSLTEAVTAELARRPIDILALCPTATRSQFAARSGFSLSNIPGAQSPDHVARRALATIGYQTTLTMGPVSTALFGGTAFGRAAAARVLGGVMRLVR